MNHQDYNMKIAKLLYPEAVFIYPIGDASPVMVILRSRVETGEADASCFLEEDGYRTAIEVDYCNNWNNLMPLVTKYLTALWKAADSPLAGISRNKWTAAYGEVLTPMADWNDNPQMALVQCLFEYLEEKSNVHTETD